MEYKQTTWHGVTYTTPNEVRSALWNRLLSNDQNDPMQKWNAISILEGMGIDTDDAIYTVEGWN
jgi:hypothetical protein